MILSVRSPSVAVKASFDDPNLVANAGLLLTAKLADLLDLEALIDSTVKLGGRTGGARPGRKVLTSAHAMIAGGRTSITPTCCAPSQPQQCSVIG